MKSLVTVLMQFVKDRPTRMNILALGRFLFFVGALITFYSVVFHYIIEYEGRSESWVTGFYWTLTVMSTLGFGDITFDSDLGRIFSTVVLLSGVLLLLVVLPFTFIEFFYAPWMKAQEIARAPRELPAKTAGHVVLTHYDNVARSLIERFKQYHYDYVLIVPDLTEALRLHDMGYRIMVGELDDPETYQRARVDKALFVASTANDQVNVNVAFTVREISETVKIIGTANFPESVDILELAGCSHVLQLGEMTGQMLARQITRGASSVAHTIGTFGDLRIAEALARGTDLVGKTLQESALGQRIGIHVLGLWVRGKFRMAHPETVVTENAIIVMAGSDAQINAYNRLFCANNNQQKPTIIIGGGRVGRAVAGVLHRRGIDYYIVEKSSNRIRDEHYILGDGAEIEVLERAGIHEANNIVVTTHDDDMNIYLTIYCRRLRPDAQIISRSALERNVATLHRAGADIVISYASTGANAIINLIGRDNILMVSEGLDIFEVDMPSSMVGKSLVECDVRKRTGCTVVALHTDEGVQLIEDPNQPLPDEARLIIIGVPESEEEFLRLYKT